MNQDRLLQRFLRYVQVNTTADPPTDRYPSSDGQWELGEILVNELAELDLQDVEQDKSGLVWGTVPATIEGAPTIAFNAHLDTSPETSGKNVQPQIVRDFAGGDIALPADASKVITVADNPELNELHGCTLITTDGTTLLGGDDKAGIAIIIEAAAYLMENPSLPHGPIKLLFTCDEEIGRGVDHVDLDKLGAVACYTLDGGGANMVDVENVFSRSGNRDLPRNKHSSVDCERTDGERRSRGRALLSAVANRSSRTRVDEWS